MRVAVFLPTLNHVKGIQQIMPRVRRDWCDQILVVDGQSTDGTAEHARAQGLEVVVQRQRGLVTPARKVWRPATRAPGGA